jgi:hypothetical protein
MEDIDEAHVMHAINTLILFFAGLPAVGNIGELAVLPICAFAFALVLDFLLFPIEAPLIIAGVALYKRYKQRQTNQP